jgi:hypothetical protein
VVMRKNSQPVPGQEENQKERDEEKYNEKE